LELLAYIMQSTPLSHTGHLSRFFVAFLMLMGGGFVVLNHPAYAYAALAPAADSSTNTADKATTIKVFYATDRARIGSVADDSSPWNVWLGYFIAAGGATLVVAAWVKHFKEARKNRFTGSFIGRQAGGDVVPEKTIANRLANFLAISAISMTLVAMLWSGYKLWQAFSYTNAIADNVIDFGGDRGSMEGGICTVSIPEDHEIGQFESPSLLHLDFKPNPQRHIVLTEVAPSTADQFYKDLKSCVGRSDRKEALVFVHGYNVTFSEAVRRVAQIAYDLKFDGAPVVFSWPSQGKLSGYTIDETNVEWTVSHLKRFLSDVAARSGAERVHLVAHSMGNRALASALKDLSREPRARRLKFGEVVLTAPDIDADLFQRDIAPAIVRIAERVTLYASSNDEALKASQEVHGYPRAGDTDNELVIVPGVDTIDVSAVDTSLLGHSYYGSNGTVLSDLFDLLHENRPPDERQWLRTQYLGSMKYWVFQR
jgi:esterase/lipase superfamily enzyme